MENQNEILQTLKSIENTLILLARNKGLNVNKEITDMGDLIIIDNFIRTAEAWCSLYSIRKFEVMKHMKTNSATQFIVGYVQDTRDYLDEHGWLYPEDKESEETK